MVPIFVASLYLTQLRGQQANPKELNELGRSEGTEPKLCELGAGEGAEDNAEYASHLLSANRPWSLKPYQSSVSSCSIFDVMARSQISMRGPHFHFHVH